MDATVYPVTNEENSGFPKPRKFTPLAASAEGTTELTAFDKALLCAGVGNINLIKISSILPPEVEYAPELHVQPGCLIPIAYSSLTSDRQGDLIAAAVGVGVSTKGNHGVIMEFSGFCSRRNAEQIVSEMVREAFEARGLPWNQLLLKGIQHKVKRVGCVFAGVLLWY